MIANQYSMNSLHRFQQAEPCYHIDWAVSAGAQQQRHESWGWLHPKAALQSGGVAAPEVSRWDVSTFSDSQPINKPHLLLCHSRVESFWDQLQEKWCSEFLLWDICVDNGTNKKTILAFLLPLNFVGRTFDQTLQTKGHLVWKKKFRGPWANFVLQQVKDD